MYRHEDARLARYVGTVIDDDHAMTVSLDDLGSEIANLDLVCRISRASANSGTSSQ
jgi:hypothetical protein